MFFRYSGDGAVALLGLLEELAPTACGLTQMVDNTVLPKLEGTHVAFEDLKTLRAFARDVECLDPAVG